MVGYWPLAHCKSRVRSAHSGCARSFANGWTKIVSNRNVHRFRKGSPLCWSRNFCRLYKKLWFLKPYKLALHRHAFFWWRLHHRSKPWIFQCLMGHKLNETINCGPSRRYLRTCSRSNPSHTWILLKLQFEVTNPLPRWHPPTPSLCITIHNWLPWRWSRGQSFYLRTLW